MPNDLAWLLLLFLRSVLKETAGQTLPPGFRYASYEVIIPRKQTPRYGEKEPQHVNYLLKIEGKSHLVYLKQKRDLVPKHFPVFTYSKKGDLQVDYPFIRDDCFYHGFVQGRALSVAAFSTCSGGLRGVLQVENKTYEIEPVPASATFQHVVYQLEEEKGATRMWCGLTQEEHLRQIAMFQNTRKVATGRSHNRPWWTHTKYSKVVIVVEHERYVQFGRNETVIALDLLNVIHLTNTWYVPTGVQVTLVGLEIWSERNLIDISNSINVLLDSFNTWRKNTLQSRLPHDAGHLFTYKRFGGMLGLAFIGTVCWNDWSSAVESYTTTSLISFTNTFAHEHGHILGMKHDAARCTCERATCIMAAYHSNSDKFSNCSYKDYYTLMKSNYAQCLFSAAQPDREYKLTYCGNRVVEHGEQCDCGSRQNCERDPCCQSDCKLHPSVTCAFGECCSRCQYLPAGTVCRKSASVCDLPEYCNGTSEWCPEDVYVQDGALCQDSSYCYHGNCSTHEEQCKMIFGSRATVASEDCFRELNAQGDRFGNCGFYGATYTKCNSEDVLCGQIQCENVGDLPSLEGHSTIIQTRVSNRLCWGTDYHSGINIPDTGAVKDGTPCGKDRMCINKKCTDKSLLKYDCNVTKCQNRGICNSHKNCHCEYGRAPPYCLNEGYGGSIDSGPPPASQLSATFFRGVLVLLAVLVVVVIIIAGLGVYYRANLTQWHRTL